MMAIILIVLSLLVIILALFIKRHYSRWEIEGIPFIKPQIPFGNLKSVANKTKSFGLAIHDLYNQTKEPFVGIYLFFRPAILIRDVELVKNILVRDFDYFHDRGVYYDDVNDKFSAHLFALPGEKWKRLRQALTPVFTSGKLKSMFKTLLDVGDRWKMHLNKSAEANEIIEMKSLCGRYVVDVLASVAFGIETNSIENPDEIFFRMGRELTDPSSTLDALRGACNFICPEILKFLKIKGLPKSMRDFCFNIVTSTVEHREKNNITRKDLMQYLIQLRNVSELSKLDEWRATSDHQLKNMDIEEICAQVFLFYIAGSETSSSLIMYTIYELSLQPELMKKARSEVIEVLAKHENEISYECIQEMKFIDLCIQETLRKYPAAPILNRICTKDYKIPDSNYTIKEGTPIIVSLLGQHRDENNFPNAEKYDPERFSEDQFNYVPSAFMPFGDGPRNCIAYRMGNMVGKLAIALLLSNYEFVCKQEEPLEFVPAGVVLLPKNGIKMQISQLKND